MINTNYLTSIFLATLLAISSCYGQKKANEGLNNKASLDQQTIPLIIGTYTKGTSEGVYQVDFNTETGALSNLRMIARVEQPSFLTLSGDREKMYAVSEIDQGKLSLFSRQEDGNYVLDQELSTEGSTTCHVTLNEDESLVSVANYREGSLIVFGWEKGMLSKVAYFKHEGSSVHFRQKVPHPHSSYFSKGENYIYVPDLGTDEIIAYPMIDGKPTAGKVALKMDSGDGPRHMASHPTRDLWFVVGELSSVVWSLQPNADGTFEVIDKQKLLPEGIEGRSTAADVHVSPDGTYLYTSNRGHQDGYHCISVFKIQETGALKPLGNVTGGINQPRNFCLSPDGRFLLVANQYGDDIIVFKVLPDGLLKSTGHSIAVSMPACLKF